MSSFNFNMNCQNVTCIDVYDIFTEKSILECCLLDELNNSYLVKIQHWLTYYSSSFLVLPAIFLNLLSLLVLSNYLKPNSNSTTINFYMKYLCVVDILTIISKFINEIIVVRNAIRENPYPINSIVCKLTPFFESVFGITSIYTLILMSIDKLICVAFPLFSASLLRPKKAKIMCILTLILSTIYSSHNIFYQTVYIPNSNETRAYSSCTENYIDIKSVIELLDGTIRVFVPIILLCVCNLSITIILVKSRRNTVLTNRSHTSDCKNIPCAHKNHKIKNNSKKCSKASLLTIPSSETSKSIIQYKKANSEEISSNKKKSVASFKSNDIKKNKQNHNLKLIFLKSNKIRSSNYTSVMLFAVSLGFILLNLPFAIKTIYERNFPENDKILDFVFGFNNDLDKKEISKSDIIKAVRYELFVYITHFLLDLNYIANFFFYFLAGIRFRKRLYLFAHLAYKKLIN